MLKTGFPPIADHHAKILILGSMPGEASLQQQQYYAHPRNAFWFIMQSLFEIPTNASYVQNTEYLVKNHVAVWDVLHQCEREGSLDTAIKNHTIQTNDFATLLAQCSQIKKIGFNGAKAEQEYKKRVLPSLPTNIQQIELIRLPSTSPAMASLTKEQKLAEWKNLLGL
jgi:hypoxanthine-DNA glycosylase